MEPAWLRAQDTLKNKLEAPIHKTGEDCRVNRTTSTAFVLFLVASRAICAQAPDRAFASPAASAVAVSQAAASAEQGPFSRFSLGGGISPLGIGLMAGTNLTQHFNVRLTGNVFGHATSFTESGIPAKADLSLDSAGAMLDYYPFHHGFRVSPGVLFLNQNEVSATASVPSGDSFTLNDQTYYSANSNPVTGTTPIHGEGMLALNNVKPSFILTTGYGNHVPRKGHLAFPVEVGVAFIGSPTVKLNLGGWACLDQAQTICTDINGNNPIADEIQTNLHAQIAKWNSDLEPLKIYPILSAGVSYCFHRQSR